MSEEKNEFIKRKKSEKRRQAEKQIREAYSRCIDVTDTDEDGNIISSDIVKVLEINGKLWKWRITMEPEIEETYSTFDVSKALGIPRERFREWQIKDFITPSLPSMSKGTIAIFTRDDVKLVMLFLKLVEIGFKRELAAEHTNLIRSSNMINSTSFIVLKYSIRDNEPAIDMIPFFGNDKLSLKIATDEKVYFNKFPLIDNKDWEGIHIINMLNLDRELNNALKRLK